MPSKTTVDPVALLQKQLVDTEKSLGKGMVHYASQAPPVYHLSFLNPHLDYATEGGAPWNRAIALYGDESTGKSLAAFQLAAVAQGLPDTMDDLLRARISYHKGHGHDVIVARLQDELEWICDNFPNGASVMWHDIEGQFDKKRAQKLGIDTDRLLLGESNILEDVGKNLSDYYPLVNMHVLDSTSAAESALKLKFDPGKSTIGVDSRQWKEVLKHSNTYFGPAHNGTGIPNMLVMIHQMSMNIKTGANQAQASKFLKFHSSCSVRFERGSFLWQIGDVLKKDKPTGADEHSHAGRAEADGLEVFVKIDKSRTCRPFRTGAMHFNFNTLSYEWLSELATSGLYYGLLEQSGSYFKVVGEEKTLGQGMKVVYARLADDEDLRYAIMARLLDYSDER